MDCSSSETCADRFVVVSVGRGGSAAADGAYQNEVVVAGAGRHRLLSVIAAVLQDSSVGFVFLKTWRTRCDASCVAETIQEFDLISSHAFIAFRNQHSGSSSGSSAQHNSHSHWTPLPTAEFGSIDDGILLSRAAAFLMLQAASDELVFLRNETLPAACSEHLIFADAWLCWCAAELGVSVLDMRFGAEERQQGGVDDGACSASSSLYRNLGQLYEQQRLSSSAPVSPPFTERTTLGFQYFMQTLVFHHVSGPHILRIADDEDAGDSLFWDACCSRLLLDHMMFPVSLASHAAVHPLLHSKWSVLVSAANRSVFLDIFRSALLSGDVGERVSISAVRRRVRVSVSAARVLGCSVLQNFNDPDDLLVGTVRAEGDASNQFQMHAITPAVLLMKHGKPVSRRLYLATNEEWARSFGYNPLFSKDASRAFSAPKFSTQDWHVFCMLAVMSMQGRASPEFDELSREYFACSAFAAALSHRTYAAGLPRCFDLPPRAAGRLRYSGHSQAHLEYLQGCLVPAGDDEEVDDDPWKLRQLADNVRSLLLERWDLQQVRPNQTRALLYSHVCFCCAFRAGLRRRCICTASSSCARTSTRRRCSGICAGALWRRSLPWWSTACRSQSICGFWTRQYTILVRSCSWNPSPGYTSELCLMLQVHRACRCSRTVAAGTTPASNSPRSDSTGGLWP
jgi:hypothetical protein